MSSAGSKQPPGTKTTAKSTTSQAKKRGLRWGEYHNWEVMSKPWNLGLMTMTLSNLSGHLSFVFLGLGYLEDEVLNLRMYATSGICLSLLFQFFRPQPLWIPLSWNLGFLLINCAMILRLVNEKQDAQESLEDEFHQTVYTEMFEGGGLTDVEFMHLMELAEKIKYEPGAPIVRTNMQQRRLYILVKGHAQVFAASAAEGIAGEMLGTVQPNHFIGEVSFAHHLSRECEEEDAMSAAPPGASCGCVATADVVAGPNGCTVFSWSFDELRDFMHEEAHASHAIQSAMSHDMAMRIAKNMGKTPFSKYRSILFGIVVNEIITADEKMYLKKLRSQLGITELQHNDAIEQVGWTRKEFEKGYKTVKVREEYDRLAGVALTGTTISDAEKKKLLEYRVKHSIRGTDHLRVLGIHGWLLNEYEAGERKMRPIKSKASMSKLTKG